MKSGAATPWAARCLAFVCAPAVVLVAASATGQPPAPPPPPLPSGAPSPSASAAAPPKVEPAKVEVKDDPVAKALAPKGAGITLEQAAAAAAKGRPSVRVKQAELKAAAARVDQALVNYFPRLSVTGTFTLLSEVKNSLGGGAFVGALNPGLLSTGACPPGTPNAPATCVLDSQGSPVGAQAFSFPVITHSYSIVASLSVPVSDYVFRLSQAHAAASKLESAKKLELQAETLQVSADARIGYLNWTRTKGQVSVAAEAVKMSKAHLADAKNLEKAKLLIRADVLRVEAQVASSEAFEVEAKAFASIAEEQLRTYMGLGPDAKMDIGSDVWNQAADAPTETLANLQSEAMKKRLEIRALDDTVHSLKNIETVTKAGYIPRVDAFANLYIQNPNQRIFPQQDRWDATWDLGVRISFTFNDIALTAAQVAEAKAKTASVEEQKNALKDALKMEVAAAFAEAAKAQAAKDAAQRGLEAALEALRVQSDLWKGGKGKTLDILDAETEVTRARLRLLDAHVNAVVAKIKLEHATGRDTKK